MYKIFLYLLLLVVVNFILVSCKYKNYYFNDSYQIEKKWKKNQELLLQLNNYQISGSVICNFYNKKKTRLQFFFQNIDRYKYCRLILSDPIGLKSLEIDISKDGRFFISENVKNYCSLYDFEMLIKKLIDEHILLKNFQEWIIGLPGTAIHFTLNTNGFLEKVHYLYRKKNLVVLYKSYYNNTIPILPNIVEVYYDFNFRLNIKIYKWTIQ